MSISDESTIKHPSSSSTRQQAKRGWERDFELKAVYTVGVLDFVFDHSPLDDEVVHHEVQLFDKQTNRVFYDKLTYVYKARSSYR